MRIISSTFVLSVVLLFRIVVICDDVVMQKYLYNNVEAEEEPYKDKRIKKPFCNAFTGCGHKRSDESIASLMGMNSEPAVEELSRQILSQAKLWQAIQEARKDITVDKQISMKEPLKGMAAKKEAAPRSSLAWALYALGRPHQCVSSNSYSGSDSDRGRGISVYSC